VVVDLGAPAPPSTGTSSGTGSSTPPAAGSEIVLNLGNLTPGEQVTIGVNSDNKGGER